MSKFAPRFFIRVFLFLVNPVPVLSTFRNNILNSETELSSEWPNENAFRFYEIRPKLKGFVSHDLPSRFWRGKKRSKAEIEGFWSLFTSSKAAR